MHGARVERGRKPARLLEAEWRFLLYTCLWSTGENLNKHAKFQNLITQQKTLLADKGDIRVGDEYQVAHIPPVLDEGVTDPAFDEELEEPMWEPDRMEHEQIER